MIRWIIAGILTGLAAAVLAAWLYASNQNGSRQDRFEQWETCVLNGGSQCGPQPVP